MQLMELSIQLHWLRQVPSFLSLSRTSPRRKSRAQNCAGTVDDDARSSVVYSQSVLQQGRVVVRCDLLPAKDTLQSAVDRIPANATARVKHSVTRSSGFSSLRSTRNEGEVVWPVDSGVLSWTLSEDELKRLKSFSPKLILQIYLVVDLERDNLTQGRNRKESGESLLDVNNAQQTSFVAEQHLGWVSVDVRDTDVSDSNDAGVELISKVNGSFLSRSEMKMSVKARTVKKKSSPDCSKHNSIQTSSLRIDSTQVCNVEPSLVQDLDNNLPPRDNDCSQIEVGHFASMSQGAMVQESMFKIVVTLEQAKNLHMVKQLKFSTEIEGWLSYELFGVVAQTDMFSSLESPNFAPATDVFVIKCCSVAGMMTYLRAISSCLVHVCVNGEVIGSSQIPLKGLLREDESEFSMSSISGCFTVHQNGRDSKPAPLNSANVGWIKISVVLQREVPVQDNQASCPPLLGSRSLEKALHVSSLSHSLNGPREVSLGRCKKENDGTSFVPSPFAVPEKESDPYNLYYNSNAGRGPHKTKHVVGCPIERENSSDEFPIMKSMQNQLGNDWHQEELAWAERQRHREEEALKAEVRKTKIHEKNMEDEMNACQLKCRQLEDDVKKRMVDVIDLQKKFVGVDAKRRASYNERVSKVEQEMQKVKQASQHAIDMEKANCDAAHKRATLAEQKLASADARSLQLEADFQRWRSTMQHQADCQLQQEVAKLMAEKEACNVTIQKESVERNMLIVNIQQLKTNEQRLVTMLSLERQKSVTLLRKGQQQTHFQSLAQEKKFEHDGDQDELLRIKKELQNLSQSGR